MMPLNVYSDNTYDIALNDRDEYVLYLKCWENYLLGGNYMVRVASTSRLESAFDIMENDRSCRCGEESIKTCCKENIKIV